MRWVGVAARMRGMTNAFKILFENLMGRDHSEDIGVVGRIV